MEDKHIRFQASGRYKERKVVLLNRNNNAQGEEERRVEDNACTADIVLYLTEIPFYYFVILMYF